MNMLWFLLGIIACFGFELIFAVILAFKEMHNRKKHFEEMKKALDNIKIEITEEKPKKTSTKKTKTTTRKTTKKGE